MISARSRSLNSCTTAGSIDGDTVAAQSSASTRVIDAGVRSPNSRRNVFSCRLEGLDRGVLVALAAAGPESPAAHPGEESVDPDLAGRLRRAQSLPGPLLACDGDGRVPFSPGVEPADVVEPLGLPAARGRISTRPRYFLRGIEVFPFVVRGRGVQAPPARLCLVASRTS